jgi:hypothetical protein
MTTPALILAAALLLPARAADPAPAEMPTESTWTAQSLASWRPALPPGTDTSLRVSVGSYPAPPKRAPRAPAVMGVPTTMNLDAR